VFERPSTYVDGFFLEDNIAALPASVKGNQVTLAPNSSLGRRTRQWIPLLVPVRRQRSGFQPNRVIEANVYVDTGLGGGALGGKTVRFTGTTLASSLRPRRTSPTPSSASFRQPGYGDGYEQSIVPLGRRAAVLR
jgi:hypothetical protein